MTIRLTDVARELIAAGLTGDQLLDAMGRIETLAAKELVPNRSEAITGGALGRVPTPKPRPNAERTDESGQRILNPTPTTREPGVDESAV